MGDDRSHRFGGRGGAGRATLRGLVLATVAVAAFATSAEAVSARRCQRAIENGGRRYLQAARDIAGQCIAAGGSSGVISTCIFDAFGTQGALDKMRSRWSRRVARRCAGIDVGSELGYSAQCPGELQCQFQSPELDTPGDRNDILDCLACNTEWITLRTTVKLFQAAREFPTQAQSECVDAIGHGGRATLATLQDQLRRCLRRRRSVSIASCLESARVSAKVEAAMTEWRSAALAACAGLPPSERGYSSTCDGLPSFPGQACQTVMTPCMFGATSQLDAPGGEDDLLDCLACRVEEAGLGLARHLQGANLCCTDAGCNTIMTRQACQLADGYPVHYRIDNAGSLGANLPHGIAFAPDGTMYIADHNLSQTIKSVSTVPPGGSPSVLATLPMSGLPVGIALDASQNAYVTEGCGDWVVHKVTPAGDVSLFAGTTGGAGYAGDGGPATEAALAGTRKTAVDAEGNVYITGSGTLTLGCPANGTVGNAEYIRMVDTNGIIHTVAGAGPYGSAGVGGPALDAQFGILLAMIIAPDGTLLLGEGGTQRILRIDPLPPVGNVVHIAGRVTTPIGAYSGDGGPARLARFFSIEGLAQDADGNVIVSDFQNNRIRLIDTAGSIITIAGNGVTSALPGPGSGDGGPAEAAFVGCPQDAAIAPDGRIWFHNQLGARYFRTLTRVLF